MENFIDRIGKYKIIRDIYYGLLGIRNSQVLSKNKSIQGKFQGECHIIASGVSINDYNINKLGDGFKIGLGLVQFNTSIADDYFDAYIEVEPAKELNRVYGDDIYLHYKTLDKKMSKKGALIFLRYDAKKTILKHKLFNDRCVFYLSTKNFRYSKKITCDITKSIPLPQGVVSASILVSIYMGFNNIYLHGVGYACQPMQLFHYYEEDIDIEKTTSTVGLYPIGFVEEMKKIISCDSDIERDKLIKNIEIDRSICLSGFIKKGNVKIPRFTSNDGDYSKHNLLNVYAGMLDVNIKLVLPNGFESPIYKSITAKELLENN
jgi:hypothetical protein